jgi:pimeloyl-ACP methyl ester carboxylesterase
VALGPDIVVLVPGITGTVLERNGKEVWGASAGAVLHGLLSAGHSVQDLRLEDDPSDVDDLPDGVKATRLIGDVHIFPKLWKIDGYTKVAKRLQQRLKLEPGESYFELPYDWRRDNRVAARKLQRETTDWLKQRRQTHPEAKVVFVAHSMGGLICRYYIEVLGGHKDTRSLITFGTPYRGSLNALDSLVNGVRKLRFFDMTELSRSFTSIYQLLPIYPCYDVGAGDLIRLKEANELPGIDIARVRAADAFHREIEQAVVENQAAVAEGKERYGIRPVVGIEQPTNQTARRAGQRVDLLRSRDGVDEMGDGTVPRVAATPIEAGEKQAAFAATRHASLQNADAVLAHLHGLLTEPRDLGQVKAVGAPTTLSLDVDDIFLSDEPVRFAVRPSVPGEPLEAVVEETETRAQQVVPLPPSDDEWRQTELAPLPPGAYRLIVRGDPTRVEPVVDVFAVAGRSL